MNRRYAVEQKAEQILGQAKAEYAHLGEKWNNYRIDVELIGSLLFKLGVQRVPDLRVGNRSYAGFLDPQSRLIVIEKHHHKHRQRFSIAHEIGHWVLHYTPSAKSRGLYACTITDMEVNGTPQPAGARREHLRQEYEANLFAGALLMPEPSVRAMHKVTGGKLPSMTRHFNVSPKAMEIRLRQLGL